MESETKQDFSELENQILYKKTGYGRFKVFDYEASSGKTYTYSRCVADYYHLTDVELCIGKPKENFGKTLIVIKTMYEGAIVAQNIRKMEAELVDVDRPFQRFAEAINTQFKQKHPELREMDEAEYIKYIRQIPVVIITQREYLNICVDPQRGQDYYGNRELLVVDEEIDIVYNSFSVLTMTDITIIHDKYLSGCNEAQKIFDEITEQVKPYLLNNILQMKRVNISFDMAKFNKLIQAFHFQLNQALDERKYEHLKSNYKEFEQTHNADEAKMVIMNRIHVFEKFLNNDSVIKYGSYLHTYNKNCKLFTLSNNIWLDASASFNSLYTISKETFELSTCSKRIIDHSESKIILDVTTNSTTSGKEKYVDLESDMLNYMVSNISENDKILVIDNKDECERIGKLIEEKGKYPLLANKMKNNQFALVNYQAMRGSNDWGDFTKIFLLQQPQFLLVYYVFLYEYWADCKLSDEEMYLSNHVENTVGESVFGFYLPYSINGAVIQYTDTQIDNSKKLEMLRYTSQASSIYQGIKRIQRNQHPQGEYIVLIKDKRMRDIVVSQLKNVQVEFINFKITHKIDTPENVVTKLTAKIYEIEVGTIVNIDDLAAEMETSRDYIYTVIRRNPSIREVMENRQILITRLMDASWYLLNCDTGFQIKINDFESMFHINWWSNYRRSKDLKIVKSKRNLTAKQGVITIGKDKY